jgi:hypothetical protein
MEEYSRISKIGAVIAVSGYSHEMRRFVMRRFAHRTSLKNMPGRLVAAFYL